MNASLRKVLDADVFRYCAGTSRGDFTRAWWRDPGFRFTWYLRRVSHFAPGKRGPGLVPYLYNRFWLNHYRFRYGFDISPQTDIGPGLLLGHFGGVVVSPLAVLGCNVNLGQGVTIGATSRGSNKGAPILKDRVWVGAHAIIVGHVTIGADALIAPGAYVNFDVPESAVVLGNPGKVVSFKGSAGYINNTLPGTGAPAASAEFGTDFKSSEADAWQLATAETPGHHAAVPTADRPSRR